MRKGKSQQKVVTNRPMKDLRRIAFFGPNFYDYALRLLDGVFRFVRENTSYQLIDLRESLGYDTDLSSPPPWNNADFDGVVSFIGRSGEHVRNWINEPNVPIVNMTADLVSQGIPSVHSDPAAIVSLSVEHLHQREFAGYAHISHANASASEFREQLFQQTALRPLHTFQHHVEFHWPLRLEEIKRVEPQLAAFLDDLPKPAAVVGINDFTAAIVCQIAASRNWSVPEEIAILGCDDSTIARFSNPTLSSIRHDGETIGYRAAELLSKLIDRRRGEQTRIRTKVIRVPATQIIARESTRFGPSAEATMEQARLLIRREACQGVKVQEIASRLHMSQRSLERKYLQRFGITPSKEISSSRLRRSLELLHNSDLSIQRIAGMVGFKSSSAFSSFITKATGNSPRRIRHE